MVPFEKLYHLILAVSEQFVKALSWQTHGDDPRRHIAEIQVELTVLVAVTIATNKCAQDRALPGFFFHFFAVVDQGHEVGVGCLAETI